MTIGKKILFLVPYPLQQAPSQRFRFEQYFTALQSSGFHVEVQSFLTASNWKLFYEKDNVLKKGVALMAGFWKRLMGMRQAWNADYVFIHREAAPVGPPLFEWIIAKLLQKKIVYDFDDAIWLTDKRSESVLTRLVKWRGKVSTICSLSYRVSCGNEYLQQYARKFAKEVIVNPTTIDTLLLHNPDINKARDQDGDKGNEVIIGWTGSHSTLKYLHQIEPVLVTVAERWPQARFIVIADHRPAMQLSRCTFIPWRKETEVTDLAQFDIGIMPLPDDEWSKGKCGFKILQYMALRIPSICSAVGVNSSIIKHTQNGFLCSSDEEWIACLGELIANSQLRASIGSAGRRTVEESYSVNSNTSIFLALFE